MAQRWWQALQSFDVVVMLHQRSHVGEPVNDWSDVEAECARQDLTLEAWPESEEGAPHASAVVVGAERA